MKTTTWSGMTSERREWKLLEEGLITWIQPDDDDDDKEKEVDLVRICYLVER